MRLIHGNVEFLNPRSVDSNGKVSSGQANQRNLALCNPESEIETTWERRRPRRLLEPREAGEDASVPRGGCHRFDKFLKSTIHLREKVRLRTAFGVEWAGMSPLLYLGRLSSYKSASILPFLSKFLKCAQDPDQEFYDRLFSARG
jgi:hypothetical protein